MVDTRQVEQPKTKNEVLALSSNLPATPNREPQDFMTPFNGAWMPSIDPVLIGPQNYKTLVNMRYKKSGIGVEGINGYYDFNTNAIFDYDIINTGIHLRNFRDANTYVIVHSKTDAGAGRLYYSKSEIDGTEGSGEFESTQLHTDSASNLDPYLSKGPVGTVVYCNEQETKIWGGEEITPSSAYSLEYTASTPDGYITNSNSTNWAYSVDILDSIVTTKTAEYVQISTADRAGLLVFSTRKLKGIKFYFVSGQVNTNTANTTVFVDSWTGSAFTALSDVVDGTSKFSQNGTISFTEGSPKLFHYQGLYLYAYLITLLASSGTSAAQIYQISLDANIQDISNVWDGTYRPAIQVQRYKNSNKTYEDYTQHAYETSTVSVPVGVYIGAMTSSDHIIMMFEEQISGIYLVMLGELVNTANSVISNCQYWDGNSFENLTITDKTLDSDSTSSFSKTGLVYWDSPAAEYKTNLFNTTGYAYKIILSGTVSGTNPEDVVIDLVGGIPNRKNVKAFKFPALFSNRLMLCGYKDGNEGNRIDFSAAHAPDVFNGSDTSYDGSQSIYVGSSDEINAAIQLYNRFGSNIYTVLIVLKNNETWLLIGETPEDFRLYPISFNMGCPAPRTLTTAEVGFEVGESIERNVAMWLSHQGPVMFDGAVVHPLEGIENYFDPNIYDSINFDYIHKSYGWYDNIYQEWNLVIPTIESTVANKWLIYSVRQKKWFEKNTESSPFPYCGISTISVTGEQVIYAGSNDGRLYRLESGSTWDGLPITYTLSTGDIYPSNNQWDVVLIRRLKFLIKRLSINNVVLNVFISTNTSEASSSGYSFVDASVTRTNSETEGYVWYDMTIEDTDSGDEGFIWVVGSSSYSIVLNEGSDRLIDKVFNINETVNCFSITLEFQSSTSPKGFDPIMWGFQWQFIRKAT